MPTEQLITPAMVTDYLGMKKWYRSVDDKLSKLSGGERHSLLVPGKRHVVYFTGEFTTSAFIRDIVQKIANAEGREFWPVYNDIARFGKKEAHEQPPTRPPEEAPKDEPKEPTRPPAEDPKHG